MGPRAHRRDCITNEWSRPANRLVRSCGSGARLIRSVRQHPQEMEFKLTAAALDSLSDAVDALAARLPAPKLAPLPSGGFRWEYPVQSAEVVQVAKAVRMVTAIRASWRLASGAYTTESATLLRVASDIASEIDFLSEGMLSGTFNSAQQKFIDDYFKPFPTDPDELASREREYYVSRKEIVAAKARLASKAGLDADNLKRLVNYLNKGYDGYVHGAYQTAMELFNGATGTFMLDGNLSPRGLCIAKASVAGKLHEVLSALEFMARVRGIRTLADGLATRRLELHASGEPRGVGCPPL